MLFITGEDLNGTCGHGFTDQPWGKRARETMVLTRKLQDHNWAEVEEWASAYVQFTEISSDKGHSGEEAPCGASMSVHANIHIDW